MLKILSLGAGVQSTTVLLMSCEGVLPKLDAAVFADTQWEPKEVYKHLAWLEVEARTHGIPVLRGTRGDLRQDAIDFRRSGGKASGEAGHKRHASMPLYVLNPDGTIGLINRQCTSEYKIEVVERIIRRTLLGLKPGQVAPADAVEHWFGISYDEQRRMRKSENHWQTFRYPLITDLTTPRQTSLWGEGYSRQDCKDWLASRGYPEAPRSACVGCPYHSDAEWLRMKLHAPEEWADAVAFDRDIRAADAALQGEKMQGRLVGLPYLHRTCKPLDEVAFKPEDVQAAQAFGMGNECAGVCGV